MQRRKKTYQANPAAPNAWMQSWNLPAALMAWVLPGLGHYLLGEKRRAAIIAACIGLLWFGGIAIGGISVIDRKDHAAWFVGQMLVGPSVLADRYHQSLKTRYLDPDASRYEPSFGRMNEQGILYTALAGLLNLMAVVDVVYRDPNHRRTPDGPAATGKDSTGQAPS